MPAELEEKKQVLCQKTQVSHKMMVREGTPQLREDELSRACSGHGVGGYKGPHMGAAPGLAAGQGAGPYMRRQGRRQGAGGPRPTVCSANMPGSTVGAPVAHPHLLHNRQASNCFKDERASFEGS